MIPFSAADSCLLFLLAAPAHAQNITSQDWGTTDKGERVELFTLKGANGLEARITNFGGRVVNLYVPNAPWRERPMSNWASTISPSYLPQGQYLWRAGRPLCRAASAMAAAFPLNGKTYQLEKTDAGRQIRDPWRHRRHFHNKVWTAKMQDGEEPSLTLTLESPDGDGGFPGDACHHGHLYRHPE